MPQSPLRGADSVAHEWAKKLEYRATPELDATFSVVLTRVRYLYCGSSTLSIT
jgi:hypothetical protein